MIEVAASIKRVESDFERERIECDDEEKVAER
jgi:hypothetical protein